LIFNDSFSPIEKPALVGFCDVAAKNAIDARASAATFGTECSSLHSVTRVPAPTAILKHSTVIPTSVNTQLASSACIGRVITFKSGVSVSMASGGHVHKVAYRKFTATQRSIDKNSSSIYTLVLFE